MTCIASSMEDAYETRSARHSENVRAKERDKQPERKVIGRSVIQMRLQLKKIEAEGRKAKSDMIVPISGHGRLARQKNKARKCQMYVVWL
jgi:hypothetical protein